MCGGLSALSSCSRSPAQSASTSTIDGSVRSLLLSAEELPPYGTTPPTSWSVSTSGSLAPLTMCPSHPLRTLQSQGYASITFDPQSNSAPELTEQVVRSSSARSEFASMQSI